MHRVTRQEPLDIHARRAEAGAPLQRRVPERPPQADGCVMRAHEDRAGARETLTGRLQEALRMGLDRVLECAAVNLDGVWHLAAQRPREDDRPHHQVVGQRYVGTDACCHIAHGGDIGVDV